jgi:hypothetical protein
MSLKITLESEAVKFLERDSILVSNYGRYMRFEIDITDKPPKTIMGDLPVLVDYEQLEPESSFGEIGVVKGWCVRPGA